MWPDFKLPFRGFAWTLAGSGGQILMRVMFLMVLARLVEPRAWGVVGAALIVTQIAMILSTAGVGLALVQRQEIDEHDIQTALLLALGLGAAVSVMIYAAAPLLASFFGFVGLDQVLRVISVIPLLASLGGVGEGLLRRALRFRDLAVIIAVSYGVGYGGIGIGLALLDGGLWALVGAAIAEHGVRSVLLLAAARQRWSGSWKTASARRTLVFSGGMVLRQLGHELAQVADNAVVGRVLGAEALGFYGRAYQVSSLPAATVGRAMKVVMFPVLARVQSEQTQLASAYLRCTVLVALAAIPTSITLIVLAPWLIEIALGARWSVVIGPLRILALGIFFRLMIDFHNALATAAGGVYALAWREGLYAAAVFGGALLGAQWGLSGVAWGVLAAQVLAWVLGVHLCLKIVGIDWGLTLRRVRTVETARS